MGEILKGDGGEYFMDTKKTEAAVAQQEQHVVKIGRGPATGQASKHQAFGYYMRW